MRFEYYRTLLVGIDGKQVNRPLLNVVLASGNKTAKSLALVDSGADDCLFNKDYADLLGIDLSQAEQKKYTGISGTTSAWTYEVSMFIEDMPEYKITIPVAFIDSQSVNGLLGQSGFFDAFRIKFEKDHNIFEVNPSPKLK